MDFTCPASSTVMIAENRTSFCMRAKHIRSFSLARVAMVLFGGGFLTDAAAAEPPSAFHPQSMAYVLQGEDFDADKEHAVKRLAACGRDLVVIDADFGTIPWLPCAVAPSVGLAGLFC
jgi:hypothetical protein